jgi:hypothetical protein
MKILFIEIYLKYFLIIFFLSAEQLTGMKFIGRYLIDKILSRHAEFTEMYGLITF